MGPGDLTDALAGLPLLSDVNVLRGMDSMDNAGVYKLTEKLAIVQTVDFFTPVVDDPFTFGQIAVANSLSDIYTMGAKPLTAMNIVCFPTDQMDISILQKILQGGAEKMLEAGVVLLGGHSVDDMELKYGLSVTGTVHPKKLLTNGGVKAGDKLILTKPLGTGIISTAVKQGVATKKDSEVAVKSMMTLNAAAAAIMQETGVHACTDITGFGFAGHASQMAENSNVTLEINISAVPIFAEAIAFIKKEIKPGGLQKNKDFYSPKLIISEDVPKYLADILFDPQTSGGLLITVPARKAVKLLKALREGGVANAGIIGQAVKKTVGDIIVKK